MNRIRIAASIVVLGALVSSALAACDSFVSDYNRKLVFRFDAKDGTYKGSIGSGILQGPTDATFGPDGNLYVIDYGAGDIKRFDPSDGTYKGSFGSGFLGTNVALGICVGPDGLIYVTRSNSAVGVYKFKPDGTYMGTIGGGFVTNSWCVRAGTDGYIYVDDATTGRIYRFATDGTYKGSFGVGFLSTNYHGFGIDADGIAYVADPTIGGIFRFDTADGTYKGLFATGFCLQPYSVVPDGDGDLLVGDTARQWVFRFKPDGTYNGYLGFGFCSAPYFVAAGSPISGSVVFQDYNLTPDTQQLQVEIRQANSATVIQSTTVTPNTVGDFTVPACASGPVDIWVKGKHWLAKKYTNVNLNSGGISGLTFSLLNGDIDGDNTITVFDYSVLSDYFDRNSSQAGWTTVGVNGFAPVDADLDGDEAITVFDYSYISNNFDLLGDA